MAQYITSGIQTSDALVKTGETRVRSFTIAYKGVTAGEVSSLIDGLDISGHDEVPIVFDAANGTMHFYFGEEGKLFQTGLFLNKGATAGSVWMTVDYR